MMMSAIQSESSTDRGIFYDDWVSCLSAHYLHTLAEGDRANAQGLRRVLLEAGVSEGFIDALRLPDLPPEAVEIVLPEVTIAAPMAEADISEGFIDVLHLPDLPPAAVEPVPPEAAIAESVAEVETSTLPASPEPPPDLFAAQPEMPAPDAPLPEPVMIPAAAPELTPDYPSSGKSAKKSKRPPPQPTLF